jgi:hypothetical protein
MTNTTFLFFYFCFVATLTSLVLLFINFFHPNLKLQKLH